MALKLFEHPLSPYARKLKLVIYEKGIPVQRVFVNPNARREDASFQEFVLASPRLEVPVLVDGDVRIFDSTIALDYIEESWPRPAMMPDTPADRARIRMLEEMCDTQLEAINWGLMELHYFKRAAAEQTAEMTARAGEQLGRIWRRLERDLDGREFMNGARFGRGDAAVLPHLGTSELFGMPLGDRFPRLTAWLVRCRERASVQQEARELAECLRTELAGGPASGRMPIVRQYRDHRLEWMMKSGGTNIVLAGLEQGTIRFAHEFE
jgi:glutathione S-transferase/RNA polymerase-associated protein